MPDRSRSQVYGFQTELGREDQFAIWGERQVRGRNRHLAGRSLLGVAPRIAGNRGQQPRDRVQAPDTSRCPCQDIAALSDKDVSSGVTRDAIHARETNLRRRHVLEVRTARDRINQSLRICEKT